VNRGSAPAPREEAAAFLRWGASYRAPLLVRQFPPELPFGFLGRLLPTTDPIEVLLEAHPIPGREALEMLQGARAVAAAELQGGDDRGATAELEMERATAEDLARAVARRTQELWKVGLRFVAIGTSRPRVEAVRARLVERLAALGFRTRVPRYEVGAALASGQFTGAEPRPSGYWHTLPTDGVAALFPFTDETMIEPRGILVGLALADASPVFLDRWSHASHSWGIFGATGSGKSFATELLLLRTRWMRPETEVIILDPLGEHGGFVRALGGDVVSLAGGRTGRLNPLDPVTTGGDRREKAARTSTMLRALFPSLRDEEAATLDAAITRLYERGPEVPTINDLLREIETAPAASDRLGTLLEVLRSGSLGSLNGPTTVRTEASLVSVDLRGVATDQLPFHLTYVLDWAYGRMRNRPGPKLLVIDEAHLLATLDITAEFLDRVVRHVRHFEAGVVVISQNPDDFLGRASGRSMLRNLYATAFLRLTEVSAETRSFFGLTPAEAEWLPNARLPREAGYSESLWRIGELHLPLAIVAATPEYEFLTSRLDGGKPSDDQGDVAAPSGTL
jgi:hypothetical protein